MSRTKDRKKKAYMKPRLRTVSLAAGEVLAPGCKLATSGSAVGAPANCVANNCALNGS